MLKVGRVVMEIFMMLFFGELLCLMEMLLKDQKDTPKYMHLYQTTLSYSQ